MLTSLSFLSAERKSAPDYSPETQEQPVALLAQPASNERPLLEGEPLSLCSDLLRFSVPIPTVSSEGQKSKIFRDTPRSLCRRFLLFTRVRRREILRSSFAGSCISRGHRAGFTSFSLPDASKSTLHVVASDRDARSCILVSSWRRG